MKGVIFKFFFGIIPLLQFLIYFPLIKEAPILNFDDKALLSPLYNLNSIFEYHILLTKDIQPLRDFSYLIDIFMMKNFSIHTFHLHNLIIWFIILFFTYKIFERLKFSSFIGLLIVLLISLHPVNSNIIPWIAARKHLLAAFFILPAILLSMGLSHKTRKRTLYSIPLLYTLSLLSHPMHILYPIWVGFLYYQKKIKNKHA